MLKLKRILCGALLPVIFSLGMLFLVACGNDKGNQGKDPLTGVEMSSSETGSSENC